MIKQLIKHIAYWCAAKFGRHTKSLEDPQLLILMYHRILPLDSEKAKNEEPGMVISPETFDKHLSWLQNHFEIVDLNNWLNRKKNNLPIPNKSCAITFDDGWVDNYQYALPILKKHTMPATIFLVSDLVGTNKKFWPERLASLIKNIPSETDLNAVELSWLKEVAPDLQEYLGKQYKLDNEYLSQVIAKAKRLDDETLHSYINSSLAYLKQKNDATPSLLSWEQINEMRKSGLISFGSHTCTHTRLNEGLQKKKLKDEVCRSKTDLQQKLNLPVDLFCFPNGDYSESAMVLVRDSYELAVTTQNGWNSNFSELHNLKRISIHENNSNTRTKFLAQLSNWF